MISPDQVYDSTDVPGDGTRKRLWRGVRKGLKPGRASFLRIPERRSFLYGMAASLILYFSAVGLLSTVSGALEGSRPHDVRLDEAYMSAIRELEKVMPTASAAGEYVAARRIQLSTLDDAIGVLWKEAQLGDLSPLKQQRLRQLYGMKIQILQSVIEKGSITL
jgi:hypothetical protein